MAEEKNQKIKLMKIMEILRQETDEEHPMTKVELAARLVAMNVSCSPRSLIPSSAQPITGTKKSPLTSSPASIPVS